MPRSRMPRRLVLALALIFPHAAFANAADFHWTPPTGSDSQWTNPFNWLSDVGGSPGSTDTVFFTHLAQMPDTPITRGDPDPNNGTPQTDTLSIGGIAVEGFYRYDNANHPLDDWRIELTRSVLDTNNPTQVASTPFTLDVGAGDGIVRIGHFEESTIFGDPAIAIPGGLIITGQTFFENAMHSAAAGFRGTLDVRHGRLTLQDLNYDDHDALSTIGGVVDSRDDLSYIPQRLPNAELTIDHSHFDSFKTRGLLIGSIGKASVTLTNGSVLSNLKELRVGGNSSVGDESHEQSSLTMTDSHITVGDGTGGVFIGDDAAPDLIDFYNGLATLTRSSIAPSVIRDTQGAAIGVEPLDVHVGHFGVGKLQMNDSSAVTARRLFVGEKFASFGELRVNSSQITLLSETTATNDHAGQFSVGKQGLGFVVVSGTTSAPAAISARTLTLGESQNAYGDAYFDRNTTLTLADSATIGIGGQGRLTVTGRFDSTNEADQRNVYAGSIATVGTRPTPIGSDPTRTYTVTIGKIWASAGYLIVGEGGRLNVTDQPSSGADDLDELGNELWRSTDHQLVVGDDGLGWLTVHADGVARTERLIVGKTNLGTGHVLLNKVMLNANAANLNYAVPGALSVSRTAVIGEHGTGTLDVRGPYATRTNLGEIPDTFDDYGFKTASMTIGYAAGSSGTVRAVNGGQIVVNGTDIGERDLIIAREGVAFLDIGDLLVTSGSGPLTYVSGGTGGTVRVTTGEMKIGGADASIYPAAEGTVFVQANGLLDVKELTIGGTLSNGDSLTTHPGETAVVTLPGGGTDVRTFVGGTVRAERVEMNGSSTLAIESNPITSPLDPERDGGFHVADEVHVRSGDLRLGTVARSRTGTLSGDVELEGGRLIGGGTIDGDLDIDGGTISIQIDNTPRFTGFDSFHVTGEAAFSSGGVVVNLGSYVGQIGDQFDIVTFTSATRINTFDVVNTLASQPGTQWVSYIDADSYTLAVAGANGDTNFDGAVNFDDLLTLAQYYGGAGTQSWTTGDFNDDQIVDFDDLLTLAQNYGMSLLGDSASSDSFASDWALAKSLVPEPTLLAIAMLPGSLLRRRRR